MHALWAGEISAVEALRQACASLKQMCGHIKATFERERDEYVAAHPPDPMLH
jgi:hypothetical protein